MVAGTVKQYPFATRETGHKKCVKRFSHDGNSSTSLPDAYGTGRAWNQADTEQLLCTNHYLDAAKFLFHFFNFFPDTSYQRSQLFLIQFTQKRKILLGHEETFYNLDQLIFG